MNERTKRYVVIGTVVLLIAGAFLLFFIGSEQRQGKEHEATIDDLIESTSQRSGMVQEVVVASSDDRFYPLMATPVCSYYDGKELKTTPLLAAGANPQTHEGAVSSAVTRFLSAYPRSQGALIGPISPEAKSLLGASGLTPSLELISGGPSLISASVARAYWTRSDGAVLVSDDTEGYEIALGGTVIAGYLNIPLLVGDGRDVRSVLKDLGVRYVIACGEITSDLPVLKLEECNSALDALIIGMPSKDGGKKSILRDRLSIDPDYIAMADPMDTVFPRVLDSFTQVFQGEVTSVDTGSTSDPSVDPNAVKHYLEIPNDYQWANVRVSAVLDFSDSPIPKRTAEDDGQRGYVYLGYDADQDGILIEDVDSKDDHLELMVPTLAFRYLRNGQEAVGGWAYTEEPIFNAQGKHTVEMMATLNYDPLGRKVTSTYSIEVTVEKLEGPNYPLMGQASTMAPYLTLARSGLLLSSCEFSIFKDERVLSQPFCGDPSEDHRAYDDGREKVSGLMAMSNNVSSKVKDILNWLLANLAGDPNLGPEELAGRYGERLVSEPMYVAIVGDTNMIPQYYYPTQGQEAEGQEGYGVAGDLFYASIDADPDDPPNDLGGKPSSSELALGRVTGWDSQDISALLCRTLFYERIIDSFQGIKGQAWKDSALNTFGSKVPVGTAITAAEKITEAEQRTGFTVDHKHYSPLSDFRLTSDLYESSNLIFVCAHGFFYWYVPPGYKPTGVGGGFTVSNVNDMNCGPSVLWADSCVTGKIDGIQPYNALSQTFLHAGMNVYLGASRLSWGAAAIIPDMESGEAFGAYMSLVFFGHLTGYIYDKSGGLVSEEEGNMAVGQALALAKNMYVEKEGYAPGDANADTIEEFNLMGDPAFNPYEPKFDG